jgi:hypothetical protein
MACKNVCRLCDKLILSADVTFTAPNLIINIPAGAYADCGKYCIVVAQAIPDATTITAPVFITIGDGTTAYPLINCDGTAVVACSINSRTRYSVKVRTGIQDGVF